MKERVINFDKCKVFDRIVYVNGSIVNSCVKRGLYDVNRTLGHNTPHYGPSVADYLCSAN